MVNDPKDAEYVIAYKVEWKKYKVSVSEAGAPPPIDLEFFGWMFVYLPQKSAKNRLVWETRQRYQLPQRGEAVYGRPPWEQPLEKSVISKFIKLLKKTRGEK